MTRHLTGYDLGSPTGFTALDDLAVTRRDFPAADRGWWVWNEAYEEYVDGPYGSLRDAESALQERINNYTPDWY